MTDKPKKKRPSRAKPAAKQGRPSVYKPEFPDQAHKLALLGATDADVAAFFDVSVATIDKWKASKPEFLQALKSGKIEADATVAKSLFRRATGYKHKAVKILTVANGNNAGSSIEEVPYTEHYPPDATSMIFWLKNRRPDLWRDKQNVEHEAGESLAALLAAARKP